MKKILLFFIVIFSTMSLFAHNDEGQFNPNPNITPYHDAIDYLNGVTSTSFLSKPEWKAFIAKYPSWGARFSNYTQLPHRAFGEPISYPLGGNDPITKAKAFIQNELKDYRIPMDELVLTRNFNDTKFIHVDFKQVHQGKEVMWSNVGVRFSQDLKIVMFYLDAYKDIPKTNPAISQEEAIHIAEKAISTKIINSTVLPELKYFPLPNDGKTDLRLVYEVTVNTQDDEVLPGIYATYVDAINGQILYRQNKVNTIGFTVKGDIFPINSFDTKVSQPLPHLLVTINGTNYYTDENGVLNAPPAGPINPSIKLQGKYFKMVTGVNGNTVNDFTPVGVNNNDVVTYTPSNPNATERHINVYYHGNRIHDFMKMRLPLFTSMDNALTARVDRTDANCNAFYNGTSINFYTTAGGCNALSYVGDVVSHEYGHGITNVFWQSQGKNFSNGAMGEGYSDVWAMSLLKNPYIGKGFYVNQPNSLIRRYDINPKVYPQNIVGEVHADGEIIAGAWWDYAVNLSQSMPLSTAVDTMSQLFSRSHYGLANGPDGAEGQVYYDILIDALQYDDDNNNLNDGTPHFNEIVEAFARHGIYLLMNTTIEHGAWGVYNAGTQVTLDATAIADFPAFVGNMKMFYRKKGTATLDSLLMTKSGNNFTGIFPSTTMGEIYEYYFDLYDNAGQYATSAPKQSKFSIASKERNLPYHHIIGYHTVSSIDFESNLNAEWQIGVPSDNATAGKWVVDFPVGTFTNGAIVQTDKDHTSGTGKCAVTGNTSPGAGVGTGDVDGGRTTLVSQEFDLSGYSSPIISYFRWFSNSQSSSNPRKDPWRTYASYNNGNTWFQLERTFQPDVSWRKAVFVPDLNVGTKVRLMFIATDSVQGAATGTWVEAAIDDIDILEIGNGPTGIKDIATLQSVVYPNPASSSLTILTNEKGKIKYTLTNSLSQVVLSQTNQVDLNNKIQIDVQGIPTGFYFLKLEQNGRHSIHKITIKK